MRIGLLLLIIATMAGNVMPSLAQPTPTAAIPLYTGPEAGTYIEFGRNIADITEKTGQKVKVLGSTGSIDNIKQMTKGGNAVTLGIVQSDILGFMQRSSNQNTKAIGEQLSLVFPFYEEEVHILARKDIKGLRDLKDKKVVVGEQGSGNMLTAINLLALAGISAGELLHLPPAEGIVAVLSGEADAMIFVGGKPVTLFSNLAELKKSKDKKRAALMDSVHLVPVDDQRIFTEYSPTRITRDDYPFVDQPILTARVHAVLVTYQPKSKAGDCTPLQQVASSIQQHLDGLKQSGHPKWKEVDLYQEVTLWKRSPCIWKGKDFIPEVKPATDEALTKDLLDIVKYGKEKK